MPSSSLRAPSLPQGLKQEGVRGDVYLDQRWPTPTATARGLESRALDPCYSVSMLPPPRGSRGREGPPTREGLLHWEPQPREPSHPTCPGLLHEGLAPLGWRWGLIPRRLARVGLHHEE